MTGASKRQLILVTGAPRSGTTPIGHMLSLLPRAVSLYEPMGRTGDKRFRNHFPMVGEPEFDNDVFDHFLDDLRTLTLRLKPQERPYFGQIRLSRRQRLVRKIFGTQSLHSLRMARAKSLWANIVIWKDPNAAFCAADAARRGVKVVVCLRSPEAVASSFKKKGWVPAAAPIYARYAAVRGEIPEIAAILPTADLASPAQSAAILWHMIYRDLLAAARMHPNIILVDPRHMETDEAAEYCRILSELGMEFVKPIQRAIANRTGGETSVLSTGVHDWSRSVAETNSYWRTVLDEAEIDFCRAINGQLWESIEFHLSGPVHRTAPRPTP